MRWLKGEIATTALNTEMWSHKKDSKAAQLKAINGLLAESSKQRGNR